MIRTVGNKTYIVLTFEEKQKALMKIKEMGLSETTTSLSNGNRKLQPIFRDFLIKLNRSHYLVTGGIIERSTAGDIQYIQSHCTKQPTILTSKSILEYSADKQKEFKEAISYLNSAFVVNKPGFTLRIP